MDLKDSDSLKAAAIVATFTLAVIARNLLNEEKVKLRALIGEMILAVIFGLTLVFLGVIRGNSFPETMILSCLCGLGINKTVSWIAMPIIQRFFGKVSK
ncbi:MAG: hypothetical protein ACRCUH_15035 [Shewanella sp.]